MSEDISQLIVLQAVKNENNLEIAFETFNNFNKISLYIAHEFYVKLHDTLMHQLPKGDGAWSITEERIIEGRPLNIHITNSNWAGIQFGIGNYDGAGVHFFVKKDGDEKEKLYFYIKSKRQGIINPDIWYIRLDNPYNRWNTKFEWLLSIYKPTHAFEYMSTNLINLADIISKFLKES